MKRPRPRKPKVTALPSPDVWTIEDMLESERFHFVEGGFPFCYGLSFLDARSRTIYIEMELSSSDIAELINRAMELSRRDGREATFRAAKRRRP